MLALFSVRGESEIVVNPDTLMDITLITQGSSPQALSETRAEATSVPAQRHSSAINPGAVL